MLKQLITASDLQFLSGKYTILSNYTGGMEGARGKDTLQKGKNTDVKVLGPDVKRQPTNKPDFHTAL